MKLLFIILQLFCCISLMGQDIHGLIVNSNKEAVPYTNVVLVTKSDSAYLAGTVTTDDGKFMLSYAGGNESLDDCLVSVSHIGFQTMYLQAAEKMDTIVLADNEEALSEVTVTGHRSPSIKLENGKLKVNIQHTVLANTGNSIEVLSLLPFINRTSEGVSVIGRGTPLIYIDNRKVQNMDDLQKLSSDEIKRVEVDLHPGAEYGNNIRAVIRISTVRKGEGMSVSLTGQGVQTQHFNAFGFGNLNYRLNKWDFFGGVSARHTHKESPVENSIGFTDGQTAIHVAQALDNINRGYSIGGNVGLSFSNNGVNDFGVKYDFDRAPSNRDKISGAGIYMENNQNVHSEDIELIQASENTRHILNAYYITSFGKNNHLNVNFDFLSGKNRSAYTSYWEQDRNVEAHDDGDYQLYAGKAQMDHNVWGGMLNFGTEFSYTDNKSAYYTDENEGTNLTESDDKNQQMLWSLFASMEKSFGDFSLEGGLRFDLADYKYFHGGQLQEDVSRNYTKLLPYFEADYDTDDISLSLSYNSNIHRPSYGQLNGSTVYVDNYTYQRGNPLLQSAYDHVLDFMFSWKDLMVDVSHTWYKNSIMQTTQMMEGQQSILFTMENIPHYHEWSATVSYTPTFGFWRPKVETSVFKQYLTYAGQRYNKPYFTYEFDNLFRLSSNVNLSVDMWGTALGNLYLSVFRPAFRTDVGLNAALFKKKLYVWLKVTDIFHTDKERWTSDIHNIVFGKNRRLDNCGVMLQLRYVFNPQSNKYRGMTTNSEVMRLN